MVKRLAGNTANLGHRGGWLYLEGEPGGFFKLAEPLLGPMLQRQWDTNLANLKDVMETAV